MQKELPKCPDCEGGVELKPFFFMGDPRELDFYVCPKCHIAFEPEKLKPIAYVIDATGDL